MEKRWKTSACTVCGNRSMRSVADQSGSLKRNADWMPASACGKNAVAISVNACVRSAVSRKPLSADTPTNPRTDFARATSMRGKVQFVSPSDWLRSSRSWMTCRSETGWP